jgi:hypothetical protein
VLNNPLAYTDPSGYFSFGKIFKSIKKFFQSQPILALAIGIAASVALGPAGLGLTAGLWSFQGAAIAGGVSGLLTGGIKGALIGAVSGAVTFGIGGLDIGVIGQALLHGTAQGIFAEAQGGSFGPAFLAGN